MREDEGDEPQDAMRTSNEQRQDDDMIQDDDDQDSEEGDGKGVLDELLEGASDDDYDPDEDAMAQEPCAVQQPASSDDDGQRGHDAGPARSEDPAVSQPRGDWDRRSRGPGRERWDEQGRGREGGAQDTKRAAAMNFQHRALVIGEKGGHSWLDRPLLHRYFSQYGQVLDVFTPRNGRAMAYVAFDTHEQLQRALNARHVISGCTVRLIRAEKRPAVGTEPQSSPANARFHERDGEWERERQRNVREGARGDWLHEQRKGGREMDTPHSFPCPGRQLERDREQGRMRVFDKERDWDRYRVHDRERDLPQPSGLGDREREKERGLAVKPAGAGTLCGVGMTLAPVDPGRDGFCHVHDIKADGALYQLGSVRVGDKLVRVDGFYCKGVLREEIKSRVLGAPDSQVTLEFERPGQEKFQVKVRRSVPKAAHGGGNLVGAPRGMSGDDRGERGSPATREVLLRNESNEQEQVGGVRYRSDVEDAGETSCSKKRRHSAEGERVMETGGVADKQEGLKTHVGHNALVESHALVENDASNGEAQLVELERWDKSRAAEAAHALAAASCGATDDGMKEASRRAAGEALKDAGNANGGAGAGIDGSRQGGRGLPRTASADRREINESAEVEKLIAQASTRNSLIRGLLTSFGGAEHALDLDLHSSEGRVWDARMSLAQISRALERLSELRERNSEQGDADGRARLEVSLAHSLSSKCSELPRNGEESQVVEFMLQTVNFLVELDILKADVHVEGRKRGEELLLSLIKLFNRKAFDVQAENLVKVFAAFSRLGKAAGQILFDPTVSYAILTRMEKILGSMKSGVLNRFLESLHALDTIFPDKLEVALYSEIKRLLRDNRFKLNTDATLLHILSRMRRMRDRNRDEIFFQLVEKMRGLFKDMEPQTLEENMIILAQLDVTVHTAVLQEVAIEAEKRIRGNLLSPRQAANILWALCKLDWREISNGRIAVTLLDAAMEGVSSSSEDGKAPATWSPWSPCTEDEQDRDTSGLQSKRIIEALDPISKDHAECTLPVAQTYFEGASRPLRGKAVECVTINQQSEKSGDVGVNSSSMERAVSSSLDSRAAAMTDAMKFSPKKQRAETSGNIYLGALDVARLLWAIAKLRMLERGRELFSMVELNLLLGFADLQPRELADMLYAVTQEMSMSLSPSLQRYLSIAAVTCANKLEAGELSVTLEGLMSGSDALPSQVIDAFLTRVKEVRRGLSIKNCIRVLQKYLSKYDKRDAFDMGGMLRCSSWTEDDEGWLEMEISRERQLSKMLVRQFCSELLHLAERLDATAISLIMRAVAIFGLKLSPVEGRNLSRRTLSILSSAGGGSGADHVRGGRGAQQEGFDHEQLVSVLAGFIASGHCSEDVLNEGDDVGLQRGVGERASAANIVEVLCKELQERMNSFSDAMLAEAFVAVAIGGVSSSWNALDTVDSLNAMIEVPVENAGTKSANCRQELLSSLLGALTHKHKDLSGFALSNIVCACAFAEQSCGMAGLLQDERIDLLLQEAGKKVTSMGVRRGCAVLCVFALCASVPSKFAFVEITKQLVKNSSKLSSRELAIALHAIAVLNQQSVAEEFRTLTHEALKRLNARTLHEWGLQSPGVPVPLDPHRMSNLLDPKDALGVNGSGLRANDHLQTGKTSRFLSNWQQAGVSSSAMHREEDEEPRQWEQLANSVTMVLWAQTVMSQYPQANTEFFQRHSQRKVKWSVDSNATELLQDVTCEVPSTSAQADGGSSQETNAAPSTSEPSISTTVDPKVETQNDVTVYPEAQLAAKLYRRLMLWVDEDEDPKVGDSCASRKFSEMGKVQRAQVMSRLHEVSLGLQLANKRSIEAEVAALFEETESMANLQQLGLKCKQVFAAEQQRAVEQRMSEYIVEICEASSDLGLELEQGIVDEVTGISMSAGSSKQCVLVDVLLDEDIVSGEETGIPILRGGRSLRRRLLEDNKWCVVQLRLSSWLLVRHHNLEKKRFLFAPNRLRDYSGMSNWCEEFALSNSLEAVDGCVALMAFLEKILCIHPLRLKALDAPMITSCFRKLALPPYPPPSHDIALADGGGVCAEAMALRSADAKLKTRVEDIVAKSGLQARALELVDQLSFSDSLGVLVCIAQVWSSLDSPRGVLQRPLLDALCDKISKDLVPTELSASAAERLALALYALAVPLSGECELSFAALRAGVGVALARCREVSAAGAAAGGAKNSFLMSLDPEAATALANAAALLVPLSTKQAKMASGTSLKRTKGRLFVVDEVWDSAADSWQKQWIGPDESLRLQVTALSTRLASLASGSSLSAAQLMQLVRVFARGTTRDVSLFRSIVNRISDLGVHMRESENVPGDNSLSANDLVDLVIECVRHRLHIERLPKPLMDGLQHPLVLAALSRDDMITILWSMAWGAFWDSRLWATLVRAIRSKHQSHHAAEQTNSNKQESTEGGEDVLLQVRRDVMLLWAIAAAGRVHYRSSVKTRDAHLDEMAASAKGAWTEDEGVLCRAALCRIASAWGTKRFEIRSSISYTSIPQLPDAHVEMLRQAMHALRFLEQDGSLAKVLREGGSNVGGNETKERNRLLHFVNDLQHAAVLTLEQQLLIRGVQLDQKRCSASSLARQEVANVLSALGHQTTILEEIGQRSSALASSELSGQFGSDSQAKAGWLCLHRSGIVINMYTKLDFIDCLQLGETRASPHLSFMSMSPTPGGSISGGRALSEATAAAGVAKRVLNIRWRLWEEQMQLLHNTVVLPLPFDIWQECQEEAAGPAMESLTACLPTRSDLLTQLVTEASAVAAAISPALRRHVTFTVDGRDGASQGNGEEEDGGLSHGADIGGVSPGLMSEGSPVLSGDGSPMDVDADEKETGRQRGIGAKKGTKKRRGAEKSRKLWKIEFSQSKKRWYYFNSKTRQRLWKPPEVEGWIIKSGSGKHRPYVGLKSYYYNSSTGMCSYEPPLNR